MVPDTDGKCPCLDPRALPRQLSVGGHSVGIVGLTEIIDVVRGLGLTDDGQIKKELLDRVKKRNWVPDSSEEEYTRALLSEYKKSPPDNETR